MAVTQNNNANDSRDANNTHRKNNPRFTKDKHSTHRANGSKEKQSAHNSRGAVNNPRRDARSAAYESLLRCECGTKYSNLEIDSAIGRYQLEGAEKRLYTTLVYGVIESKLTLEYIIAKLANRPTASLDCEVKTLLCLGLYQLTRLDRIPEHAAVNETVELAKRVCPRAASFINALLRAYLRNDKNAMLPEPTDRIKYLSVKYSVAEELIGIFDSSLESPDETERLLAAFNILPHPTLTTNTLKLSRDELLRLLSDNNIEAYRSELSLLGVKLRENTISDKIRELISDGYVYIQDEASQLALKQAAPKPGETVLDVCACPGGKSFTAAIMMRNQGRLLAFDIHKSKLSLIESGAKRLGITIITTAERDARVFDESLALTADLVICDVPCSGLGVIAKKPELRYKSVADIVRLPEIQYSILENCARYVKPGGRLSYSTCTINRGENSDVVNSFLAKHTEFTPKYEKQLLPHIDGTDGFYICVLSRADA